MQNNLVKNTWSSSIDMKLAIALWMNINGLSDFINECHKLKGRNFTTLHHISVPHSLSSITLTSVRTSGLKERHIKVHGNNDNNNNDNNNNDNIDTFAHSLNFRSVITSLHQIISRVIKQLYLSFTKYASTLHLSIGD